MWLKGNLLDFLCDSTQKYLSLAYFPWSRPELVSAPQVPLIGVMITTLLLDTAMSEYGPHSLLSTPSSFVRYKRFREEATL